MLFANFLRTWSLIRSSFLFALLPFTSLWSTCSWSVTSYPPLLLSKQRLWEKTHLPRLAWWIADSIRTNVWAFRLSLVLSPPWASSVRMWLQMGSGRRHTSSMPFSSALGLHNFMDDSSFYCLLLSFYRCLYFHQLEIQIEIFFWTLILSSTSFFPLFSYFFSLLAQNSIRISCFHELHSFFFFTPSFMACNLTFTPATIHPGWTHYFRRHSYALLYSNSISVIQKVFIAVAIGTAFRFKLASDFRILLKPR